MAPTKVRDDPHVPAPSRRHAVAALQFARYAETDGCPARQLADDQQRPPFADQSERRQRPGTPVPAVNNATVLMLPA